MQNFRTNGSAVAEKNGNSHTYIEKYNIGLDTGVVGDHFYSDEIGDIR